MIIRVKNVEKKRRKLMIFNWLLINNIYDIVNNIYYTYLCIYIIIKVNNYNIKIKRIHL